MCSGHGVSTRAGWAPAEGRAKKTWVHEDGCWEQLGRGPSAHWSADVRVEKKLPCPGAVQSFP